MVATRRDEIDLSEHAFYYVNRGAKIHHTAKLEPFSVIEDDVEIGENTIIGPHCFIRSGSRIGSNCIIGGYTCLEGKGATIGNRVRLGTHCNIGWDCVIEDYAFIGGNFTGANDKKMAWHRPQLKIDIKGYRIKRGARIGLGVVILPGVTIGEEAEVGVGSIVTKDVPDKEVWFGQPAVKRGFVPFTELIPYGKS